jgi:hypothetical protein
MEIKVNIPTNDYVQPTEIRQDVVQRICNVILKYYLDTSSEVRFTDEKSALFIGERTITNREFEGFTRIRGCEMNAAFQALKQAGYYIYGFYNSTWQEHTYNFSKKPVYRGSNHHVQYFAPFID